jgi:hypothetical protein
MSVSMKIAEVMLNQFEACGNKTFISHQFVILEESGLYIEVQWIGRQCYDGVFRLIIQSVQVLNAEEKARNDVGELTLSEVSPKGVVTSALQKLLLCLRESDYISSKQIPVSIVLQSVHLNEAYLEALKKKDMWVYNADSGSAELSV